jgi:ABC-type dipeptide/oligopeptide/nickel transport system permease subunit
VKPPAQSWGNLAADGVAEVNPHVLADSRWWLLVFPCVLLGCTLLALNFLGEGLREAVDPKRTKR